MATLRVGTRASALAVAQSTTVAERLAAATGHDVELVRVHTEGDRTQATGESLSLGGTGVFASALREALLETAGIPAELKWPNDVLVRGRKIAGILAQLGPMGDGAVPPVILGTGLNVTLTDAELPVPTATSVLLENPRSMDRTELLKSYLSRFCTLYRGFCNADGDPAAGLAGGPALHKRVEHVLTTLGKQVRAQLPGDHEIIGHASRLDEYGSLLVVDEHGREHVVTAGDVVHLRPWSPPGTESGYA